MNTFFIKTLSFLFVISGFFLVGQVAAGEDPRDVLAGAIGNNDSIIVRDAANGDVLFEKNSDKPLIPASILKVVTSLAALHYLGEDYRFTTECYQRRDGALIVKGYGDPAFVSEEIDRMAEAVSRKIDSASCIVVDGSFFASPLNIPGRVKDSLEPYDAPNGALCANYNTVSFSRQRGCYVSAEAQTPLLPFAVDRVRSSGIAQGRIMIITNQQEAAVYAGKLFAYFLGLHGCRVDGQVVEGRVNAKTDQLVFRHTSRSVLTEVVARLMQYSNNFTANQLLLCCGAEKYGPPATLAKGLRAVNAYLHQSPGIHDIQMVEGSGLSRGNRVSARTMSMILDAFTPYQTLMRRQGDTFYKTGNLSDVSTRAGYITVDSGRRYQYVVMLNSPDNDAGRFMPPVRHLIRSR